MEATAIKRPAADIEEDIREFIRSYDPLKQATHHLTYHADENGKVTLTGNVRSVQAHRVLVDNVPDIEGVTAVDSSGLFDDESLRLEAGKLLPRGMLARVNYGHISLYGMVPLGINIGEVIQTLEAHPGVHHIDTRFMAG